MTAASIRTPSFLSTFSDPCWFGPGRGRVIRLEAGPLALRQEKAKDLAVWASSSPKLSDLSTKALAALCLPLVPDSKPPQGAASWGQRKSHTYLAGAPPSVFIHLWRERHHSVNHYNFSPQNPARCTPRPAGGRQGRPRSRGMGASKDHAAGGIQGEDNTAACFPRSAPQCGEERRIQGQGYGMGHGSKHLSPHVGLQTCGGKNSQRYLT